MEALIPPPWRPLLQQATQAATFQSLVRFVEQQRATTSVFPAPDHVFTALRLTPPASVRVVLLGQDPYHDDGQAHGLCFSVNRGTPIPPSLRNIHKELQADLGHAPPGHGDLSAWASQGVLLLNSVLTVRAHQANSHRGQGWEPFTDAIIRAVSHGPQPVVFVLWGAPAQKKAALVDAARHAVLTAAHPSPLSAYKGFLGSRPFSAVNHALRTRGQAVVDWRLPP